MVEYSRKIRFDSKKSAAIAVVIGMVTLFAGQSLAQSNNDQPYNLVPESLQSSSANSSSVAVPQAAPATNTASSNVPTPTKRPGATPTVQNTQQVAVPKKKPVRIKSGNRIILAFIKSTAIPPRLCTSSKCPFIDAGAYSVGKPVKVYEISSNFARVTPYASKASYGKRYGAEHVKNLPAKLAVWFPLQQIKMPASVIKQAALKQEKEEAKLKAEKLKAKRLALKKKRAREAAAKLAEAKSNISTSVTVATAEPVKQVETAAVLSEPKTNIEDIPIAKTFPIEGEAVSVAKPANAVKPVEVATIVPKPLPKVVEAEVVKPVAIHATPKVKKISANDKRLAKLPKRAKGKLTKKDVKALRDYSIDLISSGTCKSIAEGGIALSPNFLFVKCSDDGFGAAINQFARPS